MKERPILFSAPMVRALLAGTKTQTRRIVKPQPNEKGVGITTHPLFKPDIFFRDEGEGDGTNLVSIRCPYGSRGDRLWVRETWRPIPHGYAYAADAQARGEVVRWRPSIHMPRKASRIMLEVTGIRVQHLFDITEEDCRAEGILKVPRGWSTDEGQPVSATARRAYEDLWYSIHGAWLDCWVWVIKFRGAD